MSAKKKEERLNFEEILIENFISLQKVMTNLSVKFDSLSDQISKLLQLFEIAARGFAEKQIGKNLADTEKDKELIDKLNALMDQNKTIAKGLTLMEQKIRERAYGAPQQEMRREIKARPLPSI